MAGSGLRDGENSMAIMDICAMCFAARTRGEGYVQGGVVLRLLELQVITLQ